MGSRLIVGSGVTVADGDAPRRKRHEPSEQSCVLPLKDRTGDEARDGDQEDTGEPSQATWHASMVPADLMGHKSEGSVQRASPPGEELRCRPPSLPAGAVPRPRTA